DLNTRGRKAMFNMLRKSKNFVGLDVPGLLKLFEIIVQPVALYGSEVWGYYHREGMHKIQTEFIKYILRLRKSTPDYCVFGETGTFPLHISKCVNMYRFWLRLLRKQEHHP